MEGPSIRALHTESHLVISLALISALVAGARFSTLPVLCGIGLCLGVLLIFWGFRMASQPTDLCDCAEPDAHPQSLPLHESSPQRPRDSATTVQVIRLSPDSAPTNSSQMTQQQKIAAALTRAGISNSAAWANAQSSELADTRSDVQVMTAPVDTSGAVANASGALDQKMEHRSHTQAWKRALLIAGGCVVALLSLYCFLSGGRSF